MNNGQFGIPAAQGYPRLIGWRSSDIGIWVATTSFRDQKTLHPFGRKPQMWLSIWKCKMADLGYSVGDEVWYWGSGSPAVQYGVDIGCDERGFWVNTTNAAPWLNNKSTGTPAALTAANWVFSIAAVGAVDGLGLYGFQPSGPRLNYFRTGKLPFGAFLRFGIAAPRRPTMMQLMAECIKNDGTFKPGDIQQIGTTQHTQTSQVTIGWDVSGLFCVSGGGAPSITPLTGGAGVSMTTANWLFYLQGLA